jgi:Domain of unknown function (DUF927)
VLEQFYRAVLPGQGVYALFESGRKRHTWCDDIEDLVTQTEHRAAKTDLYFATASFSTNADRTSENALYRRAFCFDIDAGEAKYAKHGDKVYASQRDALSAFMAWSADSKIRPAWVVSSGTGLHIYFLLTEDTPVAQWLPVAKSLKAMVLAQGLRIDAQVTSDVVRVLRPPGTMHPSGAVVTVLASGDRAYTLEQLADATAGFHAPTAPAREKSANSIFLDPPIGPPRVLSKITRHCAAMAHAVGSKGDVSEPYWRAMLGVIKFTADGVDAAHAASEGHPEYDPALTQRKYDAWTAGPTTCATFEDENPAACAGCRHHGKIKSPILLGELNDDEVATRPDLKPAVSAPITEPASIPDEFAAFSDLEDEPAPAPVASDPWTAFLPEGFRCVAVAGGYVMTGPRPVKAEDVTAEPGEKRTKTTLIDTPFAAVPFWFESWAAGSHDSDQALATFCVFDKTRRVVSRYTMPTKAAAQRDSLLGMLAAQNVQVYPSTNTNKQLMEDFVKASLERIRQGGQRQKILDRFGTVFNEKGEILVAQGKHIIQADGTIIEGVVQEKLKSRSPAYRVPLPENMSGQWPKSVWTSHVAPRAKRHIEYLREFYSEDNFKPYQLAIMLAWGSPMLAFMQGTFHPGTPLPSIGFTVSLYSPKSGVGKSAAMHAAALAFGPPSAIVLQLDQTNSTGNARGALLLQSGTMPSFMDEMEDLEAKDLASLVSSVGNGATKKRLNEKMALTGGEPMALINLMSTNKSHRELIAADRNESAAVQMRLLEIECSAVQAVSQARALAETEARSKLHDCAGAVGALIHYAMCSMGHEKLNRLGIVCADKARTLASGEQEGRIMYRALGATLAVRQILAGLGLKVFDDAALITEFKRWHDIGFEFAAERILPSEGADLMSMLLSDLAVKTVITVGETDLRKRDSKYDVALNDRVPDDVVARSVLSGHYVYVKTDAVRDWAFKKRVSYRTIINRCREVGIIETLPGSTTKIGMQVDLHKGMRASQGVRSFVIKVDLRRLGGDVEGTYERHIGNNIHALRPVKEAS